MSTDGKEKDESRFPKSSLRARSKTVMMEPSKLEGFRADSLWQDADMLNVDDLLEDNVPEIDVADTVDTSGDESSLHEQPVAFSDHQSSAELDLQEQVSPEDEVSVEDFQGEEEGADIENPRQEEVAHFDMAREEPSQHDSSGYEDFLEGERSDAMEGDVEFEEEYERLDEDSSSLEYSDGDHIVWRRQTRLVGFLVALDGAEGDRYVELHEGRLLISSEQNATENCLVIPHPSVSTMHAIMRISRDGSILILDQLSEHGTTIKRVNDAREQSLMGDKEALHHGDVVVFGECAYNVCIIDFGVSKVDA